MALLPELDTRSILHVVEENFEKIGLKTFAERMIYAGEHTLTKEELIDNFQKTIDDVNLGYCDIGVRGFLLVYDNYFVHVIEGSEDTIFRHLRFLFAREANRGGHEDPKIPNNSKGLQAILGDQPETKEWRMFRRLKMFIAYHSIKTLLFKDWHAVTAQPPKLISKLDTNKPIAEHMEQLRICLDKMSKLCDIARHNEKLTDEEFRALDPKMEALPEVNLLDYLLQSVHLLDLRRVVYLHRRVDDYKFYFERVWPLPTQYTPKFLYKLKIDDSFVEPLPVMPWELQKDVEEEEREEQRSGTSSSD